MDGFQQVYIQSIERSVSKYSNIFRIFFTSIHNKLLQRTNDNFITYYVEYHMLVQSTRRPIGPLSPPWAPSCKNLYGQFKLSSKSEWSSTIIYFGVKHIILFSYFQSPPLALILKSFLPVFVIFIRHTLLYTH